MRWHHQGGAIKEDWNFRISVLGCNVLTSVHFAVCLWCCMDRNESSNWLDAIFLRVHSFSVRSIISKGNYACSHPLPQKWLDQFYKLSRETFAIYASVPIRKLVLTYYCHAKLSNCVFELIILVFLLNISAMNKQLQMKTWSNILGPYFIFRLFINFVGCPRSSITIWVKCYIQLFFCPNYVFVLFSYLLGITHLTIS